MRPLALLALAACAHRAPTPTPTPSLELAVTMEREEFNRLAMALGHPWFWPEDDDGVLTLPELVTWWTPWEATPPDPAGLRALLRVAEQGFDEADLPPLERARREAVRVELAQGRPTLLHTDLTSASPQDRALAGHLLEVARGIERLHALQQGVEGLAATLPDGASRMGLWRNQRPECVTPIGERLPGCSMVPGAPARQIGVYPADLRGPGACARLESEHPELLDPFTVVRRAPGGALEAVPYPEAWPEETAAVADALDRAAAVLGPDEQALAAYLRAAAGAFRDGDWFAADAAWAEMSAESSRWYLRVGPDETYWEDCNRKAGFHLVWARVDAASAAWQRRLEPHKQDMEATLAALAGPPYAPRQVAFDLPEFIEVVLNAGESRRPTGGTIGQSLPNWGPVAEAGGRTVAMTNLFQDADSRRAHDAQVASLICPESLAPFRDDREPLLVSTLLHEAAHNLGPSHDFAPYGQTDAEALGGSLASTFEELKAQTAALLLSDWLAERGAIDRDLARRAHAADLAWGLGKIAEGMVSADGVARAYPQLASIQLGFLHDRGVLPWHDDRTAANGRDVGCFTVDLDALPAAVHELAREVLQIKATLDRPRAEALKARWVDQDGPWADLRDEIARRWLRTESATLVYAITL